VCKHPDNHQRKIHETGVVHRKVRQTNGK
jgi:hypothetical protein